MSKILLEDADETAAAAGLLQYLDVFFENNRARNENGLFLAVLGHAQIDCTHMVYCSFLRDNIHKPSDQTN